MYLSFKILDMKPEIVNELEYWRDTLNEITSVAEAGDKLTDNQQARLINFLNGVSDLDCSITIEKQEDDKR